MEIREKFYRNRSYILVFFVFIVLSILIPLTSGDDLDWGTYGGLERLATHFRGYNGRYVGNIIILAITRFTVLRVVFYALINTLLVYSITKLSLYSNRMTPILTTTLLLVVSVDVYAQTFGWYSGFANYNVSIALSLFVWSRIRSNPVKKIDYFMIPVLTLFAQLCMENVTIYNVLISAAMALLNIRKRPVKEFLYFIFSVIGVIIMFSNSAYQTIASHQDDYRTIDFNAIFDVLFTKLSQYYFINNWLILLLIAIISCILYKQKSKLACLVRFILILFPITSFLFSKTRVQLANVPRIVSISFFALGIVFLLSLILVILKLIIPFESKLWLIFVGFSTAIIIAPMLLISPFGPRVMLTSYVFFVILMNSLVGILYKENNSTVITNKVNNLLYLSFASCVIFFFGIHSVNLYSTYYRSQHFEIDDDKKTVTAYRVPFEQYAHYITPPETTYTAVRTFKEKYNIPDDYQLIFKTYTNSLLENDQ